MGAGPGGACPHTLAARIAAGPLSLTAFWAVAGQLAQAVAGLHAAGVVHGKLHPGGILWDEAAQCARIPDTVPGAQADHAAGAADSNGALPYMAPEQTGRTGRSPDWRVDLYALGAIFHALLAGAPPFAARDQIELIHALLARAPTPLDAIDPAIPPVLSGIVLKLMDKEPEQRYQDADTLLADLREAGDQWTRTGGIAPFPLARGQQPRQLRVPDRLYGRTAESAALREAFERVSRSGHELALVSGHPGIGKSALVGELEHAVRERGARFIAGKFDQLERSVPYAGLLQAFGMLIRGLLTEPDTTLLAWRERIEAAVAPNGAILLELIPGLKDILGAQPAVEELGPVEAKNRVNQVFTAFLNVFAGPARPLVLFLDDLQWIDPASLLVMQQWIGDSGSGKLLIVGAYRDDDIDRAHPLALALGELRKAGAWITEIQVLPLEREQVTELLADTLDRPPERCATLAELLLRKTAGNPFFLRRLLHTLHAQGLIRFDAAAGGWDWDIGEISRAPVSDNVVELMAQAIGRLPETARTLLQAGACIGHAFDLDTLAHLTGHGRLDVLERLWPAVADGLLLPRQDEGQTAAMRFVHVRVQQAAYAMLPETQRRLLHLDIGRHLLQGVADGEVEPILFEVVDQLDRGEALIAEPAERLRLAELNLAAGRKAKASAAYGAAFAYLAAGRRQLPPDGWRSLPALSFALHRELAECAYLTGRHQEADRLIDAALAHAPTAVARADLYAIRVLAATVAGDWDGALHWGRAGLDVFGQAWPLSGLAAANDAESLAVIAELGGRPLAALVDAPEVGDEAIRACMRLLSLLGPPAYFSGSEVLTFLVARSARLSLLHGPSVYSAYGYVFYGAVHNARTGELDVGYAFGQLALAMAQRFNNGAESSRVLEVYGLVVHVWKAPLGDSLPLMREGHRAGVASGELAYAAFNLCGVLINGLPAGVPLAELLDDAAVSIDFATRHGNRTAVEISLPFRQFALALMGREEDPEAGEERFLARAEGNQTAIGQYWVARLHAAYLLGDLDTARRASRNGMGCLSTGILGMVTTAEHAFYTALSLAAWHARAPQDERAAILDELRELLARMAHWSRHCPGTFLHKQRMVEAELARLEGAPWQAMERIGEAVAGARRAGAIHEVALANELGARLFRAHGQEGIAATYLGEAVAAYRTWGALAKTGQLERTVPGPGVPPAARAAVRELDALGLIKASQAIAAETDPERLVERILRIVVEVAGAQGGVLLLDDDGAPRVRGRIDGEDGAAAVLEDMALADCPWLPVSLIRYVGRTREPLVLGDAAREGPFAADDQVGALGLRSVLCVPLNKQQPLGMLYLENHALAHAFTAERVEVVQALAAQAAISLENSTLLREREHSERELRLLAADLSSQNRRKTEFLATLAHELRNPLAPLRTGLDLLRMPRATAESSARIHEMMGRQLNQMVHLIDDLLDIARINSGKVQLKQDRVELRDAIDSAVEATMPAIRAAGHEVTVAVPDLPLVLRADVTRLAQVFSNLLANAAKYTPPGGRIALETARCGSEVEIAVSDTGIGIPPEALDEVFDMFSQVSKNVGRSQGGLGIGLSLVRSLVQAHGGTVRAFSAGDGRGSTFVVRLPLLDGGPAQPAPAAVAQMQMQVRGGRLKILVADDNVDAGAMLMSMLALDGHDVALVHDGRQALARLAQTDIDLAILDIGMPGMNGYEVASAVRALPGRERTYLAALTGWGAEEDRNRAREAGFDAHLTKPAGLDDIRSLLDAAMARLSSQAPP